MHEASRAQCVKELWSYIKRNNLQDRDNGQYLFPDEKMAKIFGSQRLRAFTMSKFLSKHLKEMDENDNTDELTSETVKDNFPPQIKVERIDSSKIKSEKESEEPPNGKSNNDIEK